MKALLIVTFSVLGAMLHAQSVDDDMLAGLTALKKNDNRAAGVAFDRAVANDPTNGKTWYYRAVNRMVIGDNDGALEDLDHLIGMEPGDVHAMLRRAEVYRIKGDDRSANADLYRVLGLHHNGPAAEHALFELGRIAMEEKDLPNALAHYDRLIAIAPYNALAWCDRGIARNVLRDDDKAILDLEKAIDLDPTLDQAYVNLAIVLFRQDRKQEGCHALQQARDLGDRTVEELMMVHCDR
ncbi:MAG TPA: tetratricopeptide repeat protein [Flavobacteriales bacterium]|nr:tetratricopeptide repeat protein [Flavobacteriales bacterium]